MKPIICFLLLCLQLNRSQANVPVLVSPQWLTEHMTDPNLRIIQVNFLRLDYEREHIPGSVFLWPDWLAAHSPEGNFNTPDLKQAKQVLQDLGISKQTHIVLSFVKSDITVTARMFLTLEQLGLYGRVSLLDGGLEAWKKQGLPLINHAAQIPVKKGDFVPVYQQLLVNKEAVLQALSSTDQLVVDARLKRFYDGDITGNPRDGHITGAVNIPYPELIDSTNRFRPLEQIKPYFTRVGADGKSLVAYCFIGQTASVVYLAGRLLGYPIRIYDGSLQEWSRIPELPMEKTKQ
jgi:thiosulfate/3-mercaptopyruvate sulfurtransferase